MGLQDRDYYKEHHKKLLEKSYTKKNKNKPENTNLLTLIIKTSALLGMIFIIIKIVLKAKGIQ